MFNTDLKAFFVEQWSLYGHIYTMQAVQRQDETALAPGPAPGPAPAPTLPHRNRQQGRLFKVVALFTLSTL